MEDNHTTQPNPNVAGDERIILDSEPVSAHDVALMQSFRDEPVKQVERLDALAKEILKMELAMPAIYVAAVALAFGKNATVAGPLPFCAYGLWIIGLILAMVALFPRKYKVMPGVVSREGPPGRLLGKDHNRRVLCVCSPLEVLVECRKRPLLFGRDRMRHSFLHSINLCRPSSIKPMSESSDNRKKIIWVPLPQVSKGVSTSATAREIRQPDRSRRADPNGRPVSLLRDALFDPIGCRASRHV